MFKRARIRLTFEADLDGVPGWGNQVEDWVNLVRSQLIQNSHYNPTIFFTSVSVGPSAKAQSWIDEGGISPMPRVYYDLNQFNKKEK